MTCRNKDIKELLYPYAVGGLEPGAKLRAEVHLDSCKDCRAELALLRILAEEAVPDPGAAFWQAVPENVYRALEREESERREGGLQHLLVAFGRLLMPRYALPVAAAVAAVIVWLFLAPQSIKTAKKIPQESEVYLEEYSDPAMLFSPTALGNEEILNVAAWADSEFRIIEKEAAYAPVLDFNGDFYEDMAGLNAEEMKRLSSLIENLKRRV